MSIEVKMDVELEIHAPGLDMTQSRWTHHLIFMEEVHKRAHEVAARAWKCYQDKGRGTLFVNRSQWMEIVRDSVIDKPTPFPCTYVQEKDVTDRFDFDILTEGFIQVVEKYDPETHLLLTVRHHPEGLLSCYLLWMEPGPREAYEAEKEAE